MNFIKALDRRLATILLIVFVQILGASMILPILPLFAQREFNMSPQTITLLVSVFFAAQLVAGPYLGRLSDQHGRIPVLIVSQIGTVLSFLMLAFAPSAAWLFAARIFDGITGGNIIVAQAYVTDITPRKERTQSLGLIFAVFGIGFIIGPAMGGILAALFGPRMPYIFAAIIAAITVLLTWWLLDESLTPEQRQAQQQTAQPSLKLHHVLGNQPLMFIFGIAFASQFVLGILQSTFSLYGEAILFDGYSEDITNIGIGLILAFVGIGQFMTQTLLLRRLLRRYGDSWLIVIGTISRGLGFVIFALITTPWLSPISAFLFAMGGGLMMPPLQSLATSVVDDHVRGGVLGWYQSTVSLGTIISTAVAGSIFAFAPTLPYWISAGISFALVVPALILVQRNRATAAETPAAPEKAPSV